MRLFIAVELPPPVLADATIAGRTLRDRVAQHAPGARLTWVPPERMHITVRFIGNADPEQEAAITSAVSAPLVARRFTLTLGEAGTFPTRGAPRAIWLAVGDSAGAALRAVEEEVSTRLTAAGIPREPRPFRPHLTLARVRDAGGLRGSIVQGLAAPAHAGGLVGAITLFESRLSPNGPTYTALARTPLRSG